MDAWTLGSRVPLKRAHMLISKNTSLGPPSGFLFYVCYEVETHAKRLSLIYPKRSPKKNSKNPRNKKPGGVLWSHGSLCNGQCTHRKCAHKPRGSRRSPFYFKILVMRLAAICIYMIWNKLILPELKVGKVTSQRRLWSRFRADNQTVSGLPANSIDDNMWISQFNLLYLFFITDVICWRVFGKGSFDCVSATTSLVLSFSR